MRSPFALLRRSASRLGLTHVELAVVLCTFGTLASILILAATLP